jgi:hypothetical protein
MGRRSLVFLIIAAILLAAGPANAAIRIRTIHFDPPGEDAAPEPNSDLNKERVVICNTRGARRSLSRWKLVDRGPDHRYAFPRRFRLRGNRCVTVHTGRGRDTRRDLFMDLDFYVWNNDGDRATLKRRGGRVADRCSYSGSGSSVNC